jgi:hypothetical protein
LLPLLLGLEFPKPFGVVAFAEKCFFETGLFKILEEKWLDGFTLQKTSPSMEANEPSFSRLLHVLHLIN